MLRKRETMQFSWKSHENTKSNQGKSKSYETLQLDNNAKVESVTSAYFTWKRRYGLNSTLIPKKNLELHFKRIE